MTEYQDKQVTRELNTSDWFYVGDDIDGIFKVYQINAGDYFAIDMRSDIKISYEVCQNDDNEFEVY